MPQTTNHAPIIVTDSTCDLPAAFFEQYNIHTAPLYIQFGNDETYRSGIDMNMDQFFERLARGDVHPTSAQPTVAVFKELYEKLGAENRPILSIHISAGLSGTINAAQQGANMLADLPITIHNSGTVSAALGLQVLTAARAAQAGYTTEQIIPLLQQTHAVGNLLFVMDDLSYLVRGGRIGAVQYHIGQALKIKPVITVSKYGDTAGTYISAGRTRSLDRAVRFFVEHIAQEIGEENKLRAFISHGIGPTPALAAKLSEQLNRRFDTACLESTPSSPILGVHVGPHALAVGYASGDWPD